MCPNPKPKPGEQPQRAKMTISEDRQALVVEFLPDGGASGTLQLDLGQLTALIAILGKAREQMVLGQPAPSLEGAQLIAAVNPSWYILPDQMHGVSIVAFHHPGFGPIAFAIPREQVQLIVRLLSSHLAAVHDTPPASKPH